MNRSTNPGLYVHVPFCKTKCPYCDFHSEKYDSAAIDAWLDAVAREAQLYADKFGNFDSLYLGGGTPSVLNSDQLAKLLGSLHEYLDFLPNTEATIELNPDDVTYGMLRGIQAQGFNRISLGVQSLNEQELRFLRRRHSARQCLTALDAIRFLGFSNVGVDLIYGFEGHSETGWLKTLEQAVSYQPEHISCYQMTIEETTPFGKLKREGLLKILSERDERRFFLLTSQFLQSHGYVHYEISNFARGEEYTSRHNQKYWHHAPYLGLGPAAHSFQDGVRWWNVRSNEKYREVLGTGHVPVDESEILTPEQIQLEDLYLGLRTRHGVELEIIQNTPRSSVLATLEHSGLVNIDGDRVIPTLEGFLVADSLPLIFFE